MSSRVLVWAATASLYWGCAGGGDPCHQGCLYISGEEAACRAGDTTAPDTQLDSAPPADTGDSADSAPVDTGDSADSGPAGAWTGTVSLSVDGTLGKDHCIDSDATGAYADGELTAEGDCSFVGAYSATLGSLSYELQSSTLDGASSVGTISYSGGASIAEVWSGTWTDGVSLDASFDGSTTVSLDTVDYTGNIDLGAP